MFSAQFHRLCEEDSPMVRSLVAFLLFAATIALVIDFVLWALGFLVAVDPEDRSTSANGWKFGRH